jgi:hypothetical protein
MTDNFLDKTEDRGQGTEERTGQRGQRDTRSLESTKRGERLQVSEGVLNTSNRPISYIFGWFRYIISVDYPIAATDNSSNCS